MNKKILFLMIMFLLIFSSIAYAETVEDVRDVLKRNLYLYFTGATTPLSLDETKDLLEFYLSIPPETETVDCLETGSNSDVLIVNILSKGENTNTTIPTCSDGTEWGECSTTIPLYCSAGSLVYNCDYCCPSGYKCSADGKECEVEKTTTTTTIPTDCPGLCVNVPTCSVMGGSCYAGYNCPSVDSVLLCCCFSPSTTTTTTLPTTTKPPCPGMCVNHQGTCSMNCYPESCTCHAGYDCSPPYGCCCY